MTVSASVMVAALRLLGALVLTATLTSAVPVRPGARADELDDTELDTAGLLTKYGYPVERHYVTTEDGYILGVFRVPYSPESPADGTVKTPIFLHHGLTSSSADFVVNGPGKAFAYLLADAGYDVWLGNGRGNVYSRNHTTLDPDESEFWQFSWHELGQYDLPAVIDYVLDVTGQEQLYYVGHSMGTTAFFVMATERPEYNDKIRAMFALAPIAFMNHMFSPFFQVLSKFDGPIELLAGLLGIDELAPAGELIQTMMELMCQDESLTQDICSNLMFLIGGYNPTELNETMLPVYVSHAPAGASVMEVFHYAQEINSGYFRQYDHGVLNLIEYGSVSPPDYDLSLITAPVALHYSDNDWLAAVEDVQRLYEQLPNPIGMFRVTEETFNHLDFVWGIHANTLVYEKVIGLMAQY